MTQLAVRLVYRPIFGHIDSANLFEIGESVRQLSISGNAVNSLGIEPLVRGE
jgi:hypothetical protein